MLQILLAILAGVLTIGAPCILPLLPILLGTSVGQTSRSRPLFIVGGFILVFSVLGISLSFLAQHAGVNPNTLRNIAIALLAIFGALMVWPKPFELLTARINGLLNRASQAGGARRDNWGGFILGMTLGVIWTPCAGPVLGAILTLIAAQNNLGRAAILLAAYAVGAGIPMLIIAYGSQYVTTKVRAVARYSVRLQQIFGVLIILLAVAIYFNYDVAVQTKLAAYFPGTSLENRLTQTSTGTNNGQTSQMQKVELQNYGPAPELTGISQWLNSGPLTLASLRGKVVLIDFWTFSCINCIRTLPHVTKWYDTYKDQGFVVVGVHTPEFAFEKDTGNVTDAIKRFNIHYPVAQDNEFGTWNAYNNQYWPAEYLIDQNGNVVYTHFGEGAYDHTENAIRELLGMNADARPDDEADLSGVRSPEMYFGTNRLANLSETQSPSAVPGSYKLPADLKLNAFALEGTWQFDPEKASLEKGSGKIRLRFRSGKVHLVAKSDRPVLVEVNVDNKVIQTLQIGESKLYTLFDSNEYTDHTLELYINGPGFQAFTFTFG
jgi:cytochrome c biogenesis protein CcdA/thiol-disulfide isomerase/thioredoxin